MRPSTPAEVLQFQRGLDAYAAGAHYDAHEHWEVLWQDEEEPLRRDFLQGLILIAAALHKLLVMHSARGAARMLGRAQDKLATAPARAEGLDVDDLRRQLAGTLAVVEQLDREGRTDLPPDAIPRLTRAAAALH